MRHAVRCLAALTLVGACAATPVLAASSPKRGTYIDVKQQLYITTTKDVSAIKSFQAPCLRKGTTGTLVQSASMTLSRKIRIKPNGGFSYSGKARIYSGSAPKPAIENVRIRASYSGGKYKGTASFPAKYECAATPFTAKYYGVNPKG